ncbi:MAG: hypothetical protein MI807_19600 [Verrucomicrobiales bacterium]|nr:hypothetical protein [Verrucomicrobiales bacterium]
MTRFPATVFAFFSVLISANAADPPSLPSLSIREGNQSRNLDITFLGIDVECRGHLAEITYEVEFLNTTRRNQEGEFSLPLPEGATVSRYALEVKGSMRPAVSVEKERALNAYETIKRRGVDPGIVEKMEGNIFRTRIFPILPNSTKRVRIGYIRLLPKDGTFVQNWRYGEKVGTFDVKIRGAEVTTDSPDSSDAANAKEYTFQITDAEPNLKVTVQSSLTESRSDVSQAENGDRYFIVQGAAPPAAEAETTGWNRIQLVWDASRSRLNNDHELEWNSLNSLFKKLKNAEVVYRELRNTLTEPQSFAVREGKAPALKNVINAVVYDGTADFSLIPEFSGPTILVSDGIISSPVFSPAIPDSSQPAILLTPGKAKADRSFFAGGFRQHHARPHSWSNGIFSGKTPVRIDGLPARDWTVTVDDGRFYLSGRIPAKHAGKIRIHKGDHRTLSIPEAKHTGNWSFERRFHAQQKLEELEKSADRDEILAHAMSERLASDLTSLIVLEEFSDHLRFKIPPPEPELLTRYQTELATRSDRVLSRTKQGWERKRTRFHSDFPWIDTELKTEARTVSIWINASKAVFSNDLRNEEEIAPYEEWLRKAEDLLGEKQSRINGRKVAGWKTRLDDHVGNLELIRKRPAIQPLDGTIHASVRGFVRIRRIVSGEPPFSLRKALQEAGGPNHYGSPQRVYLYRNAARTGYNLEHPNHEPVMLEWGDMIVVEALPPPTFLSGHPFAADPFMAAPASGGSGLPAVFENTGSKKASPKETPVFSRPSASAPGNSSQETIDLKAKVSLALQTSRGLDQSAIDAFAEDRKAAETYRALLADRFSDSVSLVTILEVTRLLFESEEPDLAHQCLTNLLELQDNPVEASRSYAYWLFEMGHRDEALKFLTALITKSPDEATTALLHHDLGRLGAPANSFETSIKLSQTSETENRQLSTVSLVDWFRSGTNATLDGYTRDSLPADLRIVLVTSGDNLQPQLEEPEEAKQVSDSGVVRTHGKRVDEFLIRRAWPGNYHIKGLSWENNVKPVTAHVIFYTNWGRKNQKVTRKTILIEERQFALGSISFEWEE